MTIAVILLTESRQSFTPENHSKMYAAKRNGSEMLRKMLIAQIPTKIVFFMMCSSLTQDNTSN